MSNMRHQLKLCRSIRFLIVFIAGVVTGFLLSNSLTYFRRVKYVFSVPESSQGSMATMYKGITKEPYFKNFTDDVNVTKKMHQDSRVMKPKKLKLLCWIMTKPSSHKSRARHVKATWGRRCNRLLFMSSSVDEDLPAIKLNVSEGRKHLWAKTRAAFAYIYKHHFKEVDWVLKADDDSYVIVENLRHFLSTQNKSKPIYFGCKFKDIVKNGMMSGGAGYVLSKEALRLFVENGMSSSHPKDCPKDSEEYREDVGLARCMQSLSVEAGDSRDELGRGRFFLYPPENYLIPGDCDFDLWFQYYSFYPIQNGFNCCSETVISFHYMKPQMMYVFEYLLYRVKLASRDLEDGEVGDNRITGIFRQCSRNLVNSFQSISTKIFG